MDTALDNHRETVMRPSKTMQRIETEEDEIVRGENDNFSFDNSDDSDDFHSDNGRKGSIAIIRTISVSNIGQTKGLKVND